LPSAVIVPIAKPPTETTLPMSVPLDRVTVPAVLIPSTSSAGTRRAVIDTVSVAPSRSDRGSEKTAAAAGALLLSSSTGALSSI
jgi:hypothetical protein